MKKNSIRLVFLLCLFLGGGLNAYAVVLDRIIAIVEDDVVLERELSDEVRGIVAQLQANKVMIPPPFILRKQVLERIIIDKLQRQMAEKSGIRVSDDMLRASVAEIAQRNQMTFDQFRQQMESQGMRFEAFEESVRNEIIINQLRAREISTRIKVTDREVDHYLETQGAATEESVEYHLGHILIALPEAASSSAIRSAREKAQEIITKLRQGEDFKKMAISVSDGGNALQGGDLGWRTLNQVPTIFVDSVNDMGRGDVADVIRSPSGFHIIKMLDIKGMNRHMVTKTRVRHILVKTNELLNDEEARNKLLALKQRIIDGDDFSALAKANSDDKGSAIKGGDLDWVSPGVLVPPFEEAMNQLRVNQISEPIQTQFGWHLIQVLDRQNQDDSVEFKKNQARDEIRKRKIEEETELWLRRLRDEAYVEINQNLL